MVQTSSGLSGQPNPFRAVSGWIPLALAATALALLGGYLLTGPHTPNLVIEHGVTREDESAVARLWQLLMLAQMLAIAIFAAIWLPKNPRAAGLMMGLQAIAFALAALPVYLLEH
ncbi:MAG: hypothetical protein ABIT16_11380 [Croceibacterium sp.]